MSRGTLEAAVLLSLIGLPGLGAGLLLAVRSWSDRAVCWVATGVAVLTLVVAGAAAVLAGPYHRPGFGLEVDVEWIPALGTRLHLGLDGVSVPLVLLSALLGVLVCGHLVRNPPGERMRGLAVCVLLVQTGALGTFAALDLLVFFIAFETVLVPMWFVVALWGDDRQRSGGPVPFGGPTSSEGPAVPGGEAARLDAADRFILFTAVGSAVMLLGLLLIALHAGTTDLVALAERGGAGMPAGVQTVAALLVVGGLAVKVPIVPVHTWLPPAHTIAPTVGSVLLAGVLLKLGSYGLVRIVVPVLPEGMRAVAPWLGALGVAGILWGGFACLVERDLKRLVAFSSVAHMGFVVLGIASMTPAGLQGALFANVAHGLITGLLFFVVGALKQRYHSTDLRVLGAGLRDRVPRLGWLLAFGAIAGLGLPGLAGFWGELLAILGAWQSSALRPLGGALAVLAALGTVLAAAYLLRMLYACWHGPRPDAAHLAAAPAAPPPAAPPPAAPPPTAPPRDASRDEVAVTMPLVVATVTLGLLPWLLLDLTGPAVRGLLALGGAP